HLSVSSKLQTGQVIMVPGGSPEETIVAVAAARVAPRDQPSSRGIARPPERRVERPEPPPRSASPVQPQPKSPPKSVARPPANNSPKVGSGRMMWPVNGVITQ